MARVRISPLSLGFVSVIIILLFTPVVVNMLTHGNDYPAHVKSAVILEETGQFDRPRPQFLYHLSLIFLNRLIPSKSDAIAATFLSLVCYVVVGVIIFRLVNPFFYRISPRIRLILPILITIALMLIGPINILTWPEKNLYLGYLTPYSYHNPTVLLLRPFALILFILGIRAFAGLKANPSIVVLGVIVAVLSTLAKPNYGIALIPALLLVTLYFFYRKFPLDWRLLAALILPIIAVLAWQYIFYLDQGMGGFEFAPLKVVLYFSRHNLLFEFLLSLAFPIAVYGFYFRQVRGTLPLNLAWLVFGFAVLYAYLLAERKDWTDGNFFWGIEVSLMILFIFSTTFLIQKIIAESPVRRWKWQTAICVFFFALHLVSGIAFYLSSLSPNWRDWL
jgi:hypothetical protein